MRAMADLQEGAMANEELLPPPPLLLVLLQQWGGRWIDAQ
jgi:hypothetical protein